MNNITYLSFKRVNYKNTVNRKNIIKNFNLIKFNIIKGDE